MDTAKPQENEIICLWITLGEIPVFSRIPKRKSRNNIRLIIHFRFSSKAYQFSFHQNFTRSHTEPGSTVAMISAGISSWRSVI
jgi:hypothetical protein